MTYRWIDLHKLLIIFDIRETGGYKLDWNSISLNQIFFRNGSTQNKEWVQKSNFQLSLCWYLCYLHSKLGTVHVVPIGGTYYVMTSGSWCAVIAVMWLCSWTRWNPKSTPVTISLPRNTWHIGKVASPGKKWRMILQMLTAVKHTLTSASTL